MVERCAGENRENGGCRFVENRGKGVVDVGRVGKQESGI